MTIREIIAELIWAQGIANETRYPRRRRTIKAIEEAIAILNAIEAETITENEISDGRG
jgi:hypothetical protein